MLNLTIYRGTEKIHIQVTNEEFKKNIAPQVKSANYDGSLNMLNNDILVFGNK
tara:strand:+ start:423 stop:581 length:159 start_codon:yes stop_codon:yes gene_type:complete